MPRTSPYTDEQKSAIIEAVKTARKTGSWPDALKAAKDAGYKGQLQYLMKFAGGKKQQKSSKAVKPAAPGKAEAPVAAKKKAGRPKGSKNAVKKGPGRPKGAATAMNVAGLDGIEAIVSRMVEQQVGAKIGAAVKALEQTVEELKTL